jgi:hypothetical protein
MPNTAPFHLLYVCCGCLQVDEDQQLSQPAHVDLSQLLSADSCIRGITELSLTANRRRADMPNPRAWPAETEPIGSSSSSSSKDAAGAELDGTSKPYPRWGGLLGAGNDICSGSTDGQPKLQQGRSNSAGKVYNIWDHPDDAGTVVELYPMEIRTWLVEVDW